MVDEWDDIEGNNVEKRSMDAWEEQVKSRLFKFRFTRDFAN